MSTFEASRPLKRPRLHHEPSTPRVRPSYIHFNEASVKREQSPTPPPQRKSILSGTKRFAPFPPNCLPSNVAYRRNRKLWARSCQSEMESLKLTTEKLLIRDDGIIIDWKSPVPVWSDNLQPAELDLAAAITQTHHANAQHRPGSLPSTPQRSKSTPVPVPTLSDSLTSPAIKNLPVPPRPSRNVTCLPVPSLPVAGGSTEALPRLIPSTANAPAPSTALGGPLTVEIVSEEEENMSKLTMEYLAKYFQTFDSDRASLASAYSGNASFSYREVKCSSSGPQSSMPSSDVIKRDRFEITATLLSLPPLQLLPLNGSEAHIEYDMMWLGTHIGMFVVCRGAHYADSSKLAVTHSFLLRCKEEYQEDARADGVWPLLAVAHHVIVFDNMT